MAGAWHVGAGVVGLGVPDLAPGVLHHLGAGRAVGVDHATQLAVVVEARADGAKGDFLLVDHVAVVAIAAIGGVRKVGPGEAAAALRDLLALFPVAQVLAIGRPLHGLEVGLLDLCALLCRVLAGGGLGVGAKDLRLVLLDALERGDLVGLEARLDDGVEVAGEIGLLARARGATRQNDGGDRCDVFHVRVLLNAQRLMPGVAITAPLDLAAMKYDKATVRSEPYTGSGKRCWRKQSFKRCCIDHIWPLLTR